MFFHFIPGNGDVGLCREPKTCTVTTEEHFTSLEAAQAAYEELLFQGVIQIPFYRVGDLIILSGEGWDYYCSSKLKGGNRVVTAVKPDGQAEFELLKANGDWYMAWASPDPMNPLHASKGLIDEAWIVLQNSHLLNT